MVGLYKICYKGEGLKGESSWSHDPYTFLKTNIIEFWREIGEVGGEELGGGGGE